MEWSSRPRLIRAWSRASAAPATSARRGGLAQAPAAGAAPRHDHALLRERSEARGCRTRAARSARRHDRDRARARDAAAFPSSRRTCLAIAARRLAQSRRWMAVTGGRTALIHRSDGDPETGSDAGPDDPRLGGPDHPPAHGRQLPFAILSHLRRRGPRPLARLRPARPGVVLALPTILCLKILAPAVGSAESAAPSQLPDARPEKARAALRRPSIPVASVGFGRGASCLAARPEARRPAARNARPLRSAMAIPQWVSGTRLYPLVPPLPVLLESVTSGPPPFRGSPNVYRDGWTTASPIDARRRHELRLRRRRRPCRRPARAPGNVSTAMYAGSVSARPVSMSKRAPWRGQTATRSTQSNSPSHSGPSSCEHLSSIANSSPSQL